MSRELGELAQLCPREGPPLVPPMAAKRSVSETWSELPGFTREPRNLNFSLKSDIFGVGRQFGSRRQVVAQAAWL